MTALLSVDEGLISLNDGITLSLYSEVILPAEKVASEAGSSVNVMFSRVVGYLLLYPPSKNARVVLRNEIELCKDESDCNQAIYDLGHMYVTHFIQVFFMKQTKLYTPSEDPSPRCYDLLKEHIPDRSETRPRDHSHAKAAALARDNFRCMLSGHIYLRSLVEGFIKERQPGKRLVATKCCYIFPESLCQFESENGKTNTSKVSTFRAILERFGYQEVCNNLQLASGTVETTNGHHHLENIMTLTTDLHDKFDAMDTWLEGIPDKPNQYRVRVAAPVIHSDLDGTPETVKFAIDTSYPLPSPMYLHIRAACCSIAHMPGAAEFLHLAHRDMEKLKGLGEDGASADVLTYALLSLEEPTT
ncbi:hypothetical protein LXA43DRAFT_1033466 [Ganoderma leucocontextum]|nr:hypothetical protein LXA43DRAFT_1033466 [Ganoderma leucocontextum]